MAYTIWDKVFDENGGGDRSDWNNPAVRAAWAAYDAAGINQNRDINDWYYGNNSGQKVEEAAYQKVAQNDKKYIGEEANKDQETSWKDYFNQNKEYNQNKVNKVKELNPTLYDELYNSSSGNFGNIIDKAYNDNDWFKKAGNDYINAKAKVDPYQSINDSLFGPKEKAAKSTGNNALSQIKKNILEGKDAYDNLNVLTSANANKETVPTGYGQTQAAANIQINNETDLDNLLRSEFFDKNYKSTDFSNKDNDVNMAENTYLDKIRNNKGGTLLNDYWLNRDKKQSNDPRTSNTAQAQTGQAWTDLWNRYDEWMKDGHQESMDDFNKFYDTAMSEQERALLEKDVANNWGFNSWADMWDITNGADRFNKAFKAGVTGENGAYGMKEYENAGDQNNTQRYHGQDLMEKIFGRNANQRMAAPERDESGRIKKNENNQNIINNTNNDTRNENVYTEVMRDATGNALSDIDSYLKTADETAPNLVDMIQTDPGKVKELLGNNTLTLNDYSRKLVDSGYQSPLFNTGKTFGDRTIPEAEMIETSGNKKLSGDELSTMKTSEFSNPRYVDYATALLNTYLNAADLANQNTSSGYTAIDSGIPQSLQNVVAANNNANQNLLNQYLNYTESDEDKKAGGTSDQTMGDLSYSIFDNNEPFTYTGNGPEQGDVDLTALYNTHKKLKDMATSINNNQPFGNPFDVEMLRRAVNKGRGK